MNELEAAEAGAAIRLSIYLLNNHKKKRWMDNGS
jgi:hypothetical protein